MGLLPALLVLALVTLGPALYLVITSLTPLTPVNPDTAFDFSDPAGNYKAILATDEFWRSVWVQIELSVVTVSHPTRGRSGTRVVAGSAVAFSGGAAHRIPGADGAAADRRGDHLEDPLHAGHQPAASSAGVAWPAGPFADHQPEHRHLGYRRRRYVGVVSLHHADAAGGVADGTEGAAGSRSHRRRQRPATVLACAAALYPADIGGYRCCSG